MMWLAVSLGAGVIVGGTAGRAAAQGSQSRVNRELPWVTAEVRAPRLDYCTFDSALVGGRVSYHVWRPDGVPAGEASATGNNTPRSKGDAAGSGTGADGSAANNAAERLPVLYWLHGTEGGVGGIRPVARLLDEAMRAGRVPRMLVVFVNGLPRRLWSDSKDGSAPVESVFVREVIPDVEQRYRTLARREGRLLEGFSMGGYGAARLGLRHAGLFAGISILAGGPLDLDFEGPRALRNPRLRDQILREVCSDDLEYFRELSPWRLVETHAAEVRQQRLVIRHVVGDRDNTRDLNRRFHDRLTAFQIEHEYHEVPNVDHEVPGLWSGLGARQGDFYRRALGLPQPAAN